MPFNYSSFAYFSISGNTLTLVPNTIMSPDNSVINESGGSSVANTFEANEAMLLDILGTTNFPVTWLGIMQHVNTETGQLHDYHVIELSTTLSNGATHIVTSPEDAPFFGEDGTGTTAQRIANTEANYPNNFDVTTQLVTTNYAFCFARDTAIATPAGEVAVQNLRIGDMISTSDGRKVPVKWIGRQAIPFARYRPDLVEPVCISAGALGGGLPKRDLVVSSDHGMLVDGMIVNARALVNNTSITLVDPADMPMSFTYYHIETAEHDIVLAEGTPAETYVDIPGRQAFDNYAEYLKLYGPEQPVAELPIPRVISQRLLPEATKARLGIARKSVELSLG